MSGQPDPTKLRARIERDLGGRLREFPAEVLVGEDGAVTIVLRGAAGSVTALRGLREKVQPILKKAIREVLGGGYRFDTVPVEKGADLQITLKLGRI